MTLNAHGTSRARAKSRSLNRDDYLRLHREVYDRCPAAWDRLDVFRWDLVADKAFLDWGWGSDEDSLGREIRAREWIRVRRWPVSPGQTVDDAGLLEAAREAALAVQVTLHELDTPTDVGWAIGLQHRRWLYLTALHDLGGNRLAKKIEWEVAPYGQPLAVCVGGMSDKRVVTTSSTGRERTYTLGSVRGCGRTFNDLPYGRGRRWPTWCPACARAKSNAASRAETALKARVAASY